MASTIPQDSRQRGASLRIAVRLSEEHARFYWQALTVRAETNTSPLFDSSIPHGVQAGILSTIE